MTSSARSMRIPGVRESAVVGAPAAGTTAERVQAVLVTRPGGRRRRRRAQANRRLATIRGSARRRAVAGERAAADRGHAKAEAPRVESVAVRQRSRHTPRVSEQERAVSSALLERLRPGARSTPRHDPGRARPQLARTRRADDGDRECVRDHGGRGPVRRGEDRRRSRSADAAPRRRGHGGDPAAPNPSTSPSWNRSLPARAAAPHQPADLDPAARPALHVSSRSRAGTPRRRAGAGDLRRQPPEPLRHTGDPAARCRRAGDIVSRRRWRKEFFTAHFHPDQFTPAGLLQNSANYYLASLFFNAFPLPQRESGTRQTLRYIGELVSAATRS